MPRMRTAYPGEKPRGEGGGVGGGKNTRMSLLPEKPLDTQISSTRLVYDLKCETKIEGLRVILPCSGQEVSPTKFENLGGRGSDKKWKASLQVVIDGKPAGSIGHWLQVPPPPPLQESSILDQEKTACLQYPCSGFFLFVRLHSAKSNLAQPHKIS